MMVEETSSALVREYLSRKGLRNTLRVLDEELPRNPNSINDRVTLAKEIGIEQLLRRNKEQAKPFLTMIEVIVQYLEQRTHLRDELANVTARNRTSVTSIGSSERDQSRHSNSGSYWDSIDQGFNEILSLKGSSHQNSKQVRPHPVGSAPAHLQGPGGDGQRSSLDHYSRHPSMSIGSSSTLPSKSSRKAEKARTEKAKAEKAKADKADKADKAKAEKAKHNPKRDYNDNYDYGLLTPPPLPSKGHNSFFPPQNESMTNGFRGNPPRRSPTAAEPGLSGNDRSHPRSPAKMNGDALLISDIDEELNEKLSTTTLERPSKGPKTQQHSCVPIDLELAVQLRTLIFGRANGMFNAEWMMQSFSFSNLPGLSYGLVQFKGGPCGILAAVQAYVLRHLLFAKEHRNKWRGMPHPNPIERTVALASSLADIIWKAGSYRSGIVALPTPVAKFHCGGKFKVDKLTETLNIFSFNSHENLMGFLARNITHFENEKGGGCILLLYSIILTRGIKRTKDDMDEVDGTLMGSHFFCTQEVVNLMLTGKAVSNAFDDVIELDSGGQNKSILRGVDRQSTIGFLSLFEHYDSYKVGNNYKTPRHPIWVVCSESHFSVLCNSNPELLTERRADAKFDLYYYDGLARQDEEIRLTVDTRVAPKQRRRSNDIVPPLEHCIRTRWKNASISWNETEPLL